MKGNKCQNMIKSLVNTYHHVRTNQLQRLAKFFGIQEDFTIALNFLGRSGIYFVDGDVISLRDLDFSYVSKVMDSTDKVRLVKGLEKAFVILTDFFTAVPIITHFPTYRFPLVLVFATDTDIYEILYISAGQEQLAKHIMAYKDDKQDDDYDDCITRRIIIVDTVEQIEKLHIANTYSYAIVNENTGKSEYYPVDRKEDDCT